MGVESGGRGDASQAVKIWGENLRDITLRFENEVSQIRRFFDCWGENVVSVPPIVPILGNVGHIVYDSLPKISVAMPLQNIGWPNLNTYGPCWSKISALSSAVCYIPWSGRTVSLQNVAVKACPKQNIDFSRLQNHAQRPSTQARN